MNIHHLYVDFEGFFHLESETDRFPSNDGAFNFIS